MTSHPPGKKKNPNPARVSFCPRREGCYRDGPRFAPCGSDPPPTHTCAGRRRLGDGFRLERCFSLHPYCKRITAAAGPGMGGPRNSTARQSCPRISESPHLVWGNAGQGPWKLHTGRRTLTHHADGLLTASPPYHACRQKIRRSRLLPDGGSSLKATSLASGFGPFPRTAESSARDSKQAPAGLGAPETRRHPRGFLGMAGFCRIWTPSSDALIVKAPLRP